MTVTVAPSTTTAAAASAAAAAAGAGAAAPPQAAAVAAAAVVEAEGPTEETGTAPLLLVAAAVLGTATGRAQFLRRLEVEGCAVCRENAGFLFRGVGGGRGQRWCCETEGSVVYIHVCVLCVSTNCCDGWVISLS